MTKQERIHKLVNAVKRYKGAYDEESGVWLRQPKKEERVNVAVWLNRLNIIHTHEAMTFIDQCKSWKEFHVWLFERTR